jgi:hypothetical protein
MVEVVSLLMLSKFFLRWLVWRICTDLIAVGLMAGEALLMVHLRLEGRLRGEF